MGQYARLGDCRYCLAAYPTLGDEEHLTHSDDPRMGDLARALAVLFQSTDTPTDEQIGWFCQDADAVIEDHPDATEWVITDHVDMPPLTGVDLEFTLNGIPYIVQPSEWEPSHPVKRETYLSWISEDS